MDEITRFVSDMDAFYVSILANMKEKHAQDLKKKDKVRCLHKKMKNAEGESRKLEMVIRSKIAEQEALILSNEHLKKEIEEMSAEVSQVEEELKKLSVEKRRLEIVREEKVEEARKRHLALRKALAYYKQRLQCYIELVDSRDADCIVHFFASSRSSSMGEYYVKLRHNTGTWEVLEMKPPVTCRDEISRNLAESGDIISFLNHVRHLYVEHKKKRKH